MQVERVDQPADVAGVRVRLVLEDRRPLTVAVATLIHRQAVEVGAQREAYEVPGVRGQTSTVKEHQRRTGVSAPVEVVKPKLVDHDVVVGGHAHLGHIQPGQLAREP